MSKQSKERIRAIDPSGPNGVPPGVELIRMLFFQERLSKSIPDLLSPIVPGRWSSVMPDESRWIESDLIALLQKAPTDIDVIPCLCEDRIESADLF